VISWEFNGAYKAEYAAYTYIFAWEPQKTWSLGQEANSHLGTQGRGQITNFLPNQYAWRYVSHLIFFLPQGCALVWAAFGVRPDEWRLRHSIGDRSCCGHWLVKGLGTCMEHGDFCCVLNGI
jgi:hypothetical protein